MLITIIVIIITISITNIRKYLVNHLQDFYLHHHHHHRQQQHHHHHHHHPHYPQHLGIMSWMTQFWGWCSEHLAAFHKKTNFLIGFFNIPTIAIIIITIVNTITIGISNSSISNGNYPSLSLSSSWSSRHLKSVRPFPYIWEKFKTYAFSRS